MARPEWPLDPAAGPLQAFAVELRKVRAAAGNPTYRALAKTAGYSAATLSEAARGVRRPTLDVVLAYVGACRGDVDEWRRRWEALDASPPAAPDGLPPAERPGRGEAQPADRSDMPPAALAAQPPAVARASGPEPAALDEKPRRRWWFAAALAASVVGTAVATVALTGLFHEPDAVGAVCPKLPQQRLFTAETYGSGAPVRAGATESQPVLRTVPSHCTLGFTGYCLGAKIRDATSGTPDIRWFILPDGSVVPSGIVHGNPPAAAPPARCRNDRPGPGRISLAVAADTARPGGLVVTATGDNLDIVGFAVRHGAGAAQWRQLSLGDALTDTWHPAQSTGVSATDPVTIVAAACLGGGSPTGVVDARSALAGADLAAAGPSTHSAPPLASQEVTAAAKVACKYPSR